MSTTKIAWGLIRKWADFYDTTVPVMKKLRFAEAMRKAQKYRGAPRETLDRYLGGWL